MSSAKQEEFFIEIKELEGFNEFYPLGKGTTAEVRKAILPIRPEEVAIKKIRVKILEGEKEVAKKRREERFFDNELAILIQLSLENLPNIIKFYNYAVHNDEYYFIMEYGMRLEKKIPSLHFLQKIQIIKGIIQGVRDLHHLDILHRDIKTANVVLNQEYQPKIIDFGLSVQGFKKDISRCYPPKGTPVLHALELLEYRYQMENPTTNEMVNNIDFESAEVYTLTLLIWMMLHNGDDPFTGYGNNLIILMEMIRDKPKITDTCPEVFKEMMDRNFSEPNQRLKVEEMMDKVSAFQTIISDNNRKFNFKKENKIEQLPLSQFFQRSGDERAYNLLKKTLTIQFGENEMTHKCKISFQGNRMFKNQFPDGFFNEAALKGEAFDVEFVEQEEISYIG